ncbi:hypothetical protein Sinac_0362 [Singulisphaera acidiphila DSM 18658]|uniref:Uncharacterized protein n=2 Tax=Singulisphaera acidiphila TaxID=466153 RepID=L0D6B3_SINAD|nr:hypothetical protein Sinac_0362 [Singulisphaera acidiphila DSM 18658]
MISEFVAEPNVNTGDMVISVSTESEQREGSAAKKNEGLIERLRYRRRVFDSI